MHPGQLGRYLKGERAIPVTLAYRISDALLELGGVSVAADEIVRRAVERAPGIREA
jgi:molybdopterin biosynthesis enzyme